MKIFNFYPHIGMFIASLLLCACSTITNVNSPTWTPLAISDATKPVNISPTSTPITVSDQSTPPESYATATLPKLFIEQAQPTSTVMVMAVPPTVSTTTPQQEPVKASLTATPLTVNVTKTPMPSIAKTAIRNVNWDVALQKDPNLITLKDPYMRTLYANNRPVFQLRNSYQVIQDGLAIGQIKVQGYGDLTGDGIEEALLGLIWETGRGYSAILAYRLNDKGLPEYIGAAEEANYGGMIVNGLVIANQPMLDGGSICCPDQIQDTYYKVVNNKLVKQAVKLRNSNAKPEANLQVAKASDVTAPASIILQAIRTKDTAILQQNVGKNLYYIDYIEGGQNKTPSAFLAEFKSRIGSDTKCDFFTERNDGVEVWTSSWTKDWEITEFCYAGCWKVSPPRHSNQVGFFFGKANGKFTLNALWVGSFKSRADLITHDATSLQHKPCS